MKIFNTVLLLFYLLLFSCSMDDISLDKELIGNWALDEITNIIYYKFYPTGELKIHNDSYIYRWKVLTNQLIIWYEGFWSKSSEIYLNYNIYKLITNLIINEQTTNIKTNTYLIINNIKYIKISSASSFF